MVTIYLVRHAQSTGNVEKRLTGIEEYPLTLDGKKQTEKLTNYLKDINFEAVYSSESKRAMDTVKPLSEMNKLNIVNKYELNEMNFGSYDGLKWEEVNKINPIIDQKHQETNEIMGIPNQETTEEVANRMFDGISEIVNKSSNETILIASHGVAIEAFLRKITNVPFVQKVEEYSQKNASVNVVLYDENKKEYKLEILNNYKYLEDTN